MKGTTTTQLFPSQLEIQIPSQPATATLPYHVLITMPDVWCAAWLDWNIEKQVQRKAKASTGEKSVKKAIYKSKRNIASKLLLCKKCGISAHPTIPQTPRHIHSIQQFQGLTCFEIAHTITGMEVWRRCDVTNTGRAYNPQMKHDVCNQLRELHGLDPTSARKRKRKERDQSTSSDSEDSNDN
jgi:hypothetical protein